MTDQKKRTRDELEEESQLEEARSTEGEPHHELSNPVDEPDPTEYPDPYEKRPDPRGPEGGRAEGGPSTSEPHPPRNLKSVKGDKEGG